MNDQSALPIGAPDESEIVQPLPFEFGWNRRQFTQLLGGGLLFAVHAVTGSAQESPRPGGRGAQAPVSARILIGRDGRITVLSGKIEMGQGARAELSQAAAEELRVPVDRVDAVLGDTALVPDDGLTAGSRTTPATVPAVRRGAAAARQVLTKLAGTRWAVDPSTLEARDGAVHHTASGRSITFAQLAQDDALGQALAEPVPREVTVTPVSEWRVLGTSVPRPNRRDLVTGSHQYPSDIRRPGLWHGKVLRPTTYGARLVSVDLEPARAMKDVVAVQDGAFVGVAAPTTHRARQALAAIERTARWETVPQPASHEVFDHLRRHVQEPLPANPFAEDLKAAHRTLRQSYRIAYVQHAPMEPRAAVAEWTDGRLTVWTGTQNPFGYHRELSRAFRLNDDQVRVFVPDFGCGFGGKHTGEAAIEAARLARAAQRPVSLVWTRAEEFTWAYFRPAAVIDAEASLNAEGRITSWHFVTLNAGNAALDTPYRTGRNQCRAVASASSLRQGSYRALAATANTFARECFMDELAAAAAQDPLEFRLAHLEHPRLRAVLEEAARRFRWTERARQATPQAAVGLACGTEKGSYVATCAEVQVDPRRRTLAVSQICAVFECGAVLNPANLIAQIQSCLLMGLGPALREAMQFEGGRMLNASFKQYRVPRFEDVPTLDLHILPRPDLPSVGAGETPMIALAPAIANAVFRATNRRVREMPITVPAAAA